MKKAIEKSPSPSLNPSQVPPLSSRIPLFFFPFDTLSNRRLVKASKPKEAAPPYHRTLLGSSARPFFSFSLPFPPPPPPSSPKENAEKEQEIKIVAKSMFHQNAPHSLFPLPLPLFSPPALRVGNKRGRMKDVAWR